MPGHDGEWFETIRSFSSPENASQRVPISVVDSFAQMLSWFADNDPKALATIVRASGSLVRGIAPTQMLRLLHVAGKNALPRGWYAYWKGAMEDDLRVSMSWLESALPEAAREGDDQLAAESALELGKVYSRTGHLDSAKRMISLTERLAEKTASPVARVKAARLKGAVLSHWGDPIEGIACMKVAEELLTDQMERASVRATRGLFELVSGQEGRALDTLAHPNALLAETGHWLLELNCGLANALLKSKGGGFKDTIPELEQFAARSYALGCTQYGVYADELLARAHRLDGDRSESDARRRSALSGRKAAFMARTPWETRLARSLG